MFMRKPGSDLHFARIYSIITDMAGNTFGNIFRVTTFGESHGAALGCVIDGCPAGLAISAEKIQSALNRRRPGVGADGKLNAAVTARTESDTAEILSGIFEGKSTGTPIAILIRNTSQHSSDYSNLKSTFRPGHADFTYDIKYDGNRDYRGGGRSSGRETAARVAAGAVASQFLETLGIKITAYTVRAAGIEVPQNSYDFSQIEQNSMRAPNSQIAKLMDEKIQELRAAGDSAGGIIECTVEGCPAGLGEPVFDKLDAQLAKAIMSIGAVKGFEVGDGFSASDSFGSTNNDFMKTADGNPDFYTNHSGGILGGISNGNKIIFRAAVKPVPSIFKNQKTISKNDESSKNVSYKESDLQIQGRHDICLCPRIVPVVEAMTALVLADMYLQDKAARLSK